MGVSWLQTGTKSAEMAKTQAAQAEKAKQEQGKMFRFWLKNDEEARITFIDGDLSPEGFLLPPRFYEHSIFANGTYNNLYVCPEKTNPEAGDSCPLCEGQDRPSLVALFTIIDHRAHKGKNDKIYQYTRRLLVAKPATFELLNKIAIKRGGLANVTFDVLRTGGEKSASVGTMFDFVEKGDPAELKTRYTQEVYDKGKATGKIESYYKPAEYDKEIVYRTGDELRNQFGFGKPAAGGLQMPSAMQQKGQAQGQPAEAAGDFSEHL
jgi:hypothetical protein